MTQLTFEHLRTRISELPDIPTLALRVPGDGGIGRGLPQTRAVLTAARLTAEAEMRALGLAETHGNPLDRVLDPHQRASPFYHRLSQAVSNAATANAFGETPAVNEDEDRDTAHWTVDDVVRLRRRPIDNEHVGLPGDIEVGAAGYLVQHETWDEMDGWRVRFDDHGTWWTPTDTLELP